MGGLDQRAKERPANQGWQRPMGMGVRQGSVSSLTLINDSQYPVWSYASLSCCRPGLALPNQPASRSRSDVASNQALGGGGQAAVIRTATSAITRLGELAVAEELNCWSRLHQVAKAVEVAGAVVSRDTFDEGAGRA